MVTYEIVIFTQYYGDAIGLANTNDDDDDDNDDDL